MSLTTGDYLGCSYIPGAPPVYIGYTIGCIMGGCIGYCIGIFCGYAGKFGGVYGYGTVLAAG